MLIIDDDAEYRTGLRAALEKAGCGVLEAENGQIGIDVCHAMHPSVILLDVVMPVMNGAEFLRAQQADSRIMYIPVIVISTHDIGIGANVVRQLRKPISTSNLVSIIRLVVGASRHGVT